MFTLLSALLIVLVTWVAPATGQGLPPSACDDPLPQVLNVGLPDTEDRDPDAIRDLLQRIFTGRYRRLALCPDRPLQINAAVGSDYQILDWLQRGTVDLAVVSALSLHLLRRDGVALLEVTDLPSFARGWLAPAAAVVRSYEVGKDGRRRERAQSKDDLDGALDAVWTEAQTAGPRAPNRGRARFVFLSHLSTTGFLVPIAESHRWLEGRLASAADTATRDALRERFWTALFERACFRFSTVEGGAAERCGSSPDGTDETFVEIEAVPKWIGERKEDPAPHFTWDEPLHDHLVIRAQTAAAVFKPRVFTTPAARLPPDLTRLFGVADRGQRSEEVKIPSAFKSQVATEAYFGTRTFAFTIDESLRLLKLHQRTSGRAQLALVLPGGGVKAAYQSRLIDVLYKDRYLKNRLAAKSESQVRKPLDVEQVVGTSGGALLGFFVARLGANGPWDLTTVLWSGPDGKTPLSSSDVFGWTDLPRYASLVTILIVFGVVLSLVSLPAWGWFAPPLRRIPADGSPDHEAEGGRLVFLALLAIIVAACPVLVRRVSGEYYVEHVPELEGLLFAVLVVVAMFGDQCLVHDRQGAPPRPAGAPAMYTLVAGLVLMFGPALLRFGSFTFLKEEVTAGVAFLVLSGLAAMFLFAGRRRPGAATGRPFAMSLLLLGFLAGTTLAVVTLRLIPEAALACLDGMPLFFVGLLLTLAFVGLTRLARGRERAYGWVRSTTEKLCGRDEGRPMVAALGTSLAAIVLVDLTRPDALVVAQHELTTWWQAPSKLDMPLGALLVSLGSLLTLLGVVRTFGERGGRLRVKGTQDFHDAVLFLLGALSLSVYVVLGVIDSLRPDLMTLFELTLDFWIGLVAVSGVISLVLVLWGYFQRDRGRFSQRLFAVLTYLTSRHPDAHLLTRRFVRLILIAVGGLAWWNFVLAPGLYGNRAAKAHLEQVEKRFESAYDESHPDAGGSSALRLKAQLLTTANALAMDGTRFVLAVPGEQPCPPVHEPPGSGVTWYRVHAVSENGGHAKSDACQDYCRDLHLDRPNELKTLRDFVFASGSPFPIFPALRVGMPEGKLEALVDGGYSNNTPVEAAGSVAAEQVLIVNSSPPLRCGESVPCRLASLYGPLVGNVLRLPGFLYQRSQQLDRRSRARLFVLSLSPPCRDTWPFLSDFRSATVDRMRKSAEEDRDLRIGMVESWGLPRFQVSLQPPGS